MHTCVHTYTYKNIVLGQLAMKSKVAENFPPTHCKPLHNSGIKIFVLKHLYTACVF